MIVNQVFIFYIVLHVNAQHTGSIYISIPTVMSSSDMFWMVCISLTWLLYVFFNKKLCVNVEWLFQCDTRCGIKIFFLFDIDRSIISNVYISEIWNFPNVEYLREYVSDNSISYCVFLPSK